MIGRREFGDYQTPINFAQKICLFIKESFRFKPTIILEPTCGIGNILQSSLIFDAKYYIGIEINPLYCQFCREKISDSRVEIINADFFKFEFNQLPKDDDVLIVGNPPWVTNSALSALNSSNLPSKNNFKGLKGIDAMTGNSNFDLAESIILKLISIYRNKRVLLAMLCKTSSARKIYIELRRQCITFNDFNIIRFDSKKIFGVNVDSCLMIVKLNDDVQSLSAIRVTSFDDDDEYAITLVDGQLKTHQSMANFDGRCCFQWRQGVKHDCAKVMELELRDGCFINGFGEIADIENDRIFPLVKSSMFKHPIINTFSKYVIVTQKKINEQTESLKNELPKTWDYLVAHEDIFNRRKSAIYRGAPRFSVFGIGSYSFAKYKVGVSGFYKEPYFSLIHSSDGKSVMTDDTTYFIAFDEYDTAYVAMLFLNTNCVREFLKSIAFLDVKRPYTKQILMRIDFLKLISTITMEQLSKTEETLGLYPYVTESKRKKFAESVTALSDNLFSAHC